MKKDVQKDLKAIAKVVAIDLLKPKDGIREFIANTMPVRKIMKFFIPTMIEQFVKKHGKDNLNVPLRDKGITLLDIVNDPKLIKEIAPEKYLNDEVNRKEVDVSEKTLRTLNKYNALTYNDIIHENNVCSTSKIESYENQMPIIPFVQSEVIRRDATKESLSKVLS